MKLIGTLVATAWVSTVVFLVPLPQENIRLMEESLENSKEAIIHFERKSKREDAAAVSDNEILASMKATETKKIWFRWIAKCFVIVLGITAGIFSLFRMPLWRSLVVVTSVGFLAVWILRIIYVGTSGSGSTLDSILILHSDVISHGSILDAVVFYQGYLILPAIHIVLIGYLAVFHRSVGK